MRVRSLDALRGLAAFAVVIHHWALTFQPPRPVPQSGSPIIDLIARLKVGLPGFIEYGTAAVMIFFVLSGFVLALALENDRDTYLQFVLKRACRILPPLACAVVLSACLYLILDPHTVPGLSPWFNTTSWTKRPDINMVLGHWALVGGPRYESLDNVIWTLRHELRISLIFPFIAYCVRRRPIASLITSFVISAAAAWATRYVAASVADWLESVHFAFLFFFGAAIAQYRMAISQWLARRRTMERVLMLCVSVLLLVASAGSSLKGLYVLYLGAIGLVALCSADPVVIRFLERRSFLYLGKISYSLYLVHLPILLAVMHWLYGRLPNGLLVCAGIILAILISAIFNRAIEKPSQRLGRLLASGLQHWRYKVETP